MAGYVYRPSTLGSGASEPSLVCTGLGRLFSDVTEMHSPVGRFPGAPTLSPGLPGGHRAKGVNGHDSKAWMDFPPPCVCVTGAN